MIEAYIVAKWVHILSSTILFGFGAGTAWYMLNAHLTRDPATIAAVGRMVVRADWIFTGTSGLLQPASGYVLIRLAGYSPFEPWLLLAYGLYALAFACWVPVVVLQIRARDHAEASLERGEPLPPAYFAAMRWWFWLGWPAFIGLLGIFWLMVAKPALGA